MAEINDLLKTVSDTASSDLHLVVGSAPALRTQGRLSFVPNVPVLDAASASRLVTATMNPTQKERFLSEKELDYSYEIPGVARFRVNAYTQKGTAAAAFRLIPALIPSIDSLNLPPICHTFAQLHQGFILVTGPTGQGKSSTLAAILEEINATRSEHIVTIEDPVEFVYQNKKSLVSQRELGGDTDSFARALKSVLREDPNVVLVGEMRDLETMRAAMTTAETGHLVFATLHTNSASQTVDRIVDSFPEEQQEQIKSQLATSLEAVFSQRLVPTKDGKRAVAVEVMVSTPAVKSNIREGKTHQIANVIKTSASDGMIHLDKVLAGLVARGEVTLDDALVWADDPKQLKMSVF